MRTRSFCAWTKATLANELPDLGNPSMTSCVSGVTMRERSLRSSRYRLKKTAGCLPAWICRPFSSLKTAGCSPAWGPGRSLVAPMLAAFRLAVLHLTRSPGLHREPLPADQGAKGGRIPLRGGFFHRYVGTATGTGPGLYRFGWRSDAQAVSKGDWISARGPDTPARAVYSALGGLSCGF